MSTDQGEIANKIRDAQLTAQAAEQITAPLLKKGWKIVFICWALLLIPFVNFVAIPAAFLTAVVVGIIAMSKGNVGGGLKLLLVGWLGTIPLAIVSVLIMTAVGLGGFGLLTGAFG